MEKKGRNVSQGGLPLSKITMPVCTHRFRGLDAAAAHGHVRGVDEACWLLIMILPALVVVGLCADFTFVFVMRRERVVLYSTLSPFLLGFVVIKSQSCSMLRFIVSHESFYVESIPLACTPYA